MIKITLKKRILMTAMAAALVMSDVLPAYAAAPSDPVMPLAAATVIDETDPDSDPLDDDGTSTPDDIGSSTDDDTMGGEGADPAVGDDETGDGFDPDDPDAEGADPDADPDADEADPDADSDSDLDEKKDDTAEPDYSMYDNMDPGYREAVHDVELDDYDPDEAPQNTRMALRASAYPSTYITPNLPPLRDQSPYGTCWAFSSMALAEINLIHQGYTLSDAIDLSELHLAYFTYNTVTDPLGGTAGDINKNGVRFSSKLLETGGNLAFSGNVLASWIGAADESVLPYTLASHDIRPDDSLAYTDAVHLTHIYKTNYNIANLKLNPIKKMIMNNGAVGMSIHADSYFYSSDYNSYYCNSKYSMDHAITIVGWDDTFSCDHFRQGEAPADGAWLVRNSWSTGEYDNNQKYEGYFWMSYYDMSIGSEVYAFAFESADDYDNNYQYDGGMDEDPCGYATGANVFTAHASDTEWGEMLRAVSFSTNNASVDYTIDIYTGLETANDPNYSPDLSNPDDTEIPQIVTDPTSGERVATLSGKTSYAGYYTVPLEHPIQLLPGETFSVVVSLTRDGKTPELLAEYSWDESNPDWDTFAWYKVTTSSEDAHSFVYVNDMWADFGHDTQRNLRIKAFTDNITEAVYPTALSLYDGSTAAAGLEMYVTENRKLTPAFTPDTTNERALIWTSTNEEVVTVSPYGVLTAVSPGEADVIATAQAGSDSSPVVSATCHVTVTDALGAMTLTGTNTLESDESGYIYTLNPVPDVAAIPDEVTWESGNEAVLTVDNTGEVTIHGLGPVTITATTVTPDGRTVTGSLDVNVVIGTPKPESSTGDDNTIYITWPAVNCADTYEVYRGTDYIDDAHLLAAFEADENLTSYTFEDDSHTADKWHNTYFYTVIARGRLAPPNETYKGWASEIVLGDTYEKISYKITYVLNGFQNDPSNPSTGRRLQSIKLKPPVIPDNYSGVRGRTYWATEDGSPVTTVSMLGNVKLYARMEKPSYTVKYHLNDYDDSPTVSGGGKHEIDAQFTVLNLTRDGSTFLGWSRKPDLSGDLIKGGSKVTGLSQTDGDTVHLYAVWTYPIDLDPQGGTCSPVRMSVTMGQPYGAKAAIPVPHRTGYTFTGWYRSIYDEDQVISTEEITDATAVTSCEPHTLKARWRLNKYDIIFDPNGTVYEDQSTDVTGSMDAIEGCEYGKNYQLTSNAYARPGYMFAGWNTRANGSGRFYSDESVVTNMTEKDGDRVVLYAQWRRAIQAVPDPMPAVDPDRIPLASGTRVYLNTDIAGADLYYMIGDEADPDVDSLQRVTDSIMLDGTVVRRSGQTYETDADGNLIVDITVVACMTEIQPGTQTEVRTPISAPETLTYYIVNEDAYMGDVSSEAALDAIRKQKGMDPGDAVTGADIPTGLWIAGVPESVDYTGSAITFLNEEITGSTTPVLEVYSGKNRLVYGTDYTVKYANNTKAGLATVTITGKGNYAGSIVRNFTIAQLDLGSVTLGVDGADHVIVSSGSNSTSLTIPDIYLTHNARVQKGTTTVLYDVPQADASAKTVTLKAGTDFTYFYPQTDKKGDPTTYDATAFVGFKDKTSTPGGCGYTEYTVLITGKGNFSGTAAFTERIYAKDDTSTIHVSRLNVASIPAQTLTYDTDGSVKGAAPELTVKDTTVRGVTTVLEDLSGRNDILPTDDGYTLTWLNNEIAGTGTVVITGHGKYVGSRTATFKINGLAMTKVSVDTAAMSEINRKNGFAYTGSPIRWEEPDPNDPTAEPDKYYTLTYVASRGASPVGLVEGRDYDVTYSNNVNAGRNRATITFTGKGIYTGSIKRTYTITAVPLATKQGNTVTENADIAVTMADSYTYTKGGVKPEPVVTYNGEVLNAGTDYTLKYTNNNSINTRTDNGDGTYTWKDSRRIPTVTITGKGNFTGALIRQFVITASSLEDSGVTMTAADVVYSGKAGNCRTTVTLTDSNGTRLAAGSDYDKNFIYTYEFDTAVKIKEGRNVVDDPALRPAGTEVDMNRDCVQPGTILRVTATATRKGAYSGLDDPTDMTIAPSSISTTFRVIGADIGRASVKVDDQIYTGAPIELSKQIPDPEDPLHVAMIDNPAITITLNRITLSADDYEIVPGSYRNNTARGTASFTIRGSSRGTYGGTRTVTFKIVNRSMNITVAYDPNHDQATGATRRGAVAIGARLARNSYRVNAYSFAGWNTRRDGAGQSFESGGVFAPSDTVINSAGGYGGNLTLYAQWAPVPYKLTYKLNGGMADTSNPAIYTIADSVIIEAPTRTGYTFAGWYYDSRCTSKPLDTYEHTLDDGTRVITCTIPAGNTGNKTIYAKWIRNP